MALDTKSLRKTSDIFLQLRSLKKSRELQLFLALTMTKNMRSPYYGRPLLLARIDYDITGTLQNVAARFAEQHKGMDIVPTLAGALAGDSSGDKRVDTTLSDLSNQIISTMGTTRYQALTNLDLLLSKKRNTALIDAMVDYLVLGDMMRSWLLYDKGRSVRLMYNKDRDFKLWFKDVVGRLPDADKALTGDPYATLRLKKLYYKYKLNKFKDDKALLGKNFGLILRHAPVLLQRELTKHATIYKELALNLDKSFGLIDKLQRAIYGIQRGASRAETQKRNIAAATQRALNNAVGGVHSETLLLYRALKQRLFNAGINATDYTSLVLYLTATGMNNLLSWLALGTEMQWAGDVGQDYLLHFADDTALLKSLKLTTGQSALVLHNLTGRNAARMSSVLRKRLATKLAQTATVTNATVGDITQGAQRQQMVLQRLGASKATQRAAATWLMYSMTMSKMLLNKNVGSLTDLLWQHQIKQTISNAAASSGAELLAYQLAYWKQQNPGKDLKLFWDLLLNNGGNASAVTGKRVGQFRNTISGSALKLAMSNKNLQEYAYKHAVGLQNQKSYMRAIASATNDEQRAALRILDPDNKSTEDLRLNLLDAFRKVANGELSLNDVESLYALGIKEATGIDIKNKDTWGALQAAALGQQSGKAIILAHTIQDKTTQIKQQVNSGQRVLLGPADSGDKKVNNNTTTTGSTANKNLSSIDQNVASIARYFNNLSIPPDNPRSLLPTLLSRAKIYGQNNAMYI